MPYLPNERVFLVNNRVHLSTFNDALKLKWLKNVSLVLATNIKVYVASELKLTSD